MLTPMSKLLPKGPLRVLCAKPLSSDLVEVCFYVSGPGDGMATVVTGIDTEEIEVNAAMPDRAIMALGQEAAQGLFDDLWNCGLRPDKKEQQDEPTRQA